MLLHLELEVSFHADCKGLKDIDRQGKSLRNQPILQMNGNAVISSGKKD